MEEKRRKKYLTTQERKLIIYLRSTKGGFFTTDKEKARIILEELDKIIQVNWNFEKFYLKAIEKGLEKIRKEN